MVEYRAMKTDELREKYLAFFETKGCVRRPSDVLVPRWDPSVLFTPAGMNQFKDHFLGRCKLDFTRATTCQKCLRTGDIDNVGRTAYHHTFFEMLGNFSFGDYFKRDAIHWAWEFLTGKKWLGLDPRKALGHDLPRRRRGGRHLARRDQAAARAAATAGRGRELLAGQRPQPGPRRRLRPVQRNLLPHALRPGRNLEPGLHAVQPRGRSARTTCARCRARTSTPAWAWSGRPRCLQGVETNFHIDILRPLVEAAGEVCGVRYDPADENGRRLRRIADHVRACTFAVHENVYPGNKKQGYVIRRLLRRAVLDGHQLGVREPFLHKLVGRVAELMKNPYPELGRNRRRAVAGVIEKEEANFLATLDAGLDRIERIFAADETRASRRSSPAPRRPTCSKPTASRPNCSRPWPPNATWPSTGRVSARKWSSTASSRAAGRRSNSSATIRWKA